MKIYLFTTLILLGLNAHANHAPGEVPPAPHPAQLGAAAIHAREGGTSATSHEAPHLHGHHHENASTATGPEVIDLKCVRTFGDEGAWWQSQSRVLGQLMAPSSASWTRVQFENMWNRFMRMIDRDRLDRGDLYTTSFVDLYNDVVRTMFEHRGEDAGMNSVLKHRLSRPKNMRIFERLFYTSEYLDRYIKAAHAKLQRNQYAHEQIQKLQKPTFLQQRLLDHLNDEILKLRNELEELEDPIEEFDSRSFSTELARHVERFLIAYKKLGLPPPVAWEEVWAPHYGRLTEELPETSGTQPESHSVHSP